MGLIMAGRLKDRQLPTLKPGRHADGGNLFFVVRPSGSRSWVLRFQKNGRRQDMGLGPYPLVGLQEARGKAQDALRQAAKGVNPIQAREASARSGGALPTFSDIAQLVIAQAETKPENDKVRYQRRRHLGPVYCGSLLARLVNEITTRDVADVLTPVLHQKPEVARKLVRDIRKVFDAARVVLRDQHGVKMDHPALWADLKALGLTAPRKHSRGMHPSLPYEQAPEFYASLSAMETISASGLRLMMLTNMRTGTLLDATWDEFDLKQQLWTVPRLHLKDREYRKEDFRLPLSSQAVQLLEELKRVQTSKFVLSGYCDDGSLSDGAFLQLVKRMNLGERKWIDTKQNKRITPHGFRATYRTWAGDKAQFPRDLIEESYGHQVASAVERSYWRGDALDERRKLAQAWADYITAK